MGGKGATLGSKRTCGTVCHAVREDSADCDGDGLHRGVLLGSANGAAVRVCCADVCHRGRTVEEMCRSRKDEGTAVLPGATGALHFRAMPGDAGPATHGRVVCVCGRAGHGLLAAVCPPFAGRSDCSRARDAVASGEGADDDLERVADGGGTMLGKATPGCGAALAIILQGGRGG